VLVNTALAVAKDPPIMGSAFRKAVEAGRLAYLSGLGAAKTTASPTSPLTAFLG
jgi:thiazole synthase